MTSSQESGPRERRPIERVKLLVVRFVTDRSAELNAARLAEAQSLLEINQRRRAHAETTSLLTAITSLVLCTAAICTDESRLILLVAPVALLLTSFAFQQYADVTVLGAARARLEGLVNDALRGRALIYECHVAGIRKRPPLVSSVALLQLVVRGSVVAGVAAGTWVALGQPGWVAAAYAAATLVTAASCAFSYRDMRRAWVVASTDLRDLL
ncbi:MAG TPA: hypothetical protein VN238_13300 [Solirubrobacteraceae bacterium]|nr:hypothetical protein [Solirubrobacteraceae bacterium]